MATNQNENQPSIRLSGTSYSAYSLTSDSYRNRDVRAGVYIANTQNLVRNRDDQPMRESSCPLKYNPLIYKPILTDSATHASLRHQAPNQIVQRPAIYQATTIPITQNIKPQTFVQPQAIVQLQSIVPPKRQTIVQPQPQTIVQPQSFVKPQTIVQPKPQPQTIVQPQPQTIVQPQSFVKPHTIVQPQPQTIVQPQLQPQTIFQPQIAVYQQPQPPRQSQATHQSATHHRPVIEPHGVRAYQHEAVDYDRPVVPSTRREDMRMLDDDRRRLIDQITAIEHENSQIIELNQVLIDKLKSVSKSISTKSKLKRSAANIQ